MNPIKLKSINLIPEEFFKKPLHRRTLALSGRNRKLRYSIIIVLALSVVIPAIIIPLLNVHTFQYNLSESRAARQETKAKLEKLRSRYLQLEKQRANLLKEEQVKRQGMELLLSGSSGNRGYAKLLSFISGLLPQELWLTRLVLTDSEIQLAGSTLDNQLVTQLISKLEASKKFKHSRFVSSEKRIIEAQTIYNFQLSAEPLWERLIWPAD